LSGIEQAVHGGPAGGHASGQGGLGKGLALHRILDLQGDCALHGAGIHGFKQAFVGEEGIEGTTGVRIFFLNHGHEGIEFCA
jgi:hypothetical protein